MGVGSQRHAQAALLPGKGPGAHRSGNCVGPRAGLKRWGKSHSNGIRPPDRPAHSKSLCLLRYPGPSFHPRTETNQVSVASFYISQQTMDKCQDTDLNKGAYVTYNSLHSHNSHITLTASLIS